MERICIRIWKDIYVRVFFTFVSIQACTFASSIQQNLHVNLHSSSIFFHLLPRTIHTSTGLAARRSVRPVRVTLPGDSSSTVNLDKLVRDGGSSSQWHGNGPDGVAGCVASCGQGKAVGGSPVT